MILSKEELDKEYVMSSDSGYPHNKELDEKTKNLSVRVEFEVTCDSSPYVGYEESIAKRIKAYIDQCIEAMDGSMRHWGDHNHCIDPVKVIISNDREEQDITDEMLGED